MDNSLYYHEYLFAKDFIIFSRKSPTVFVCIFGIVAIFSYGMDPNELPDLDYAELWYEERPIPQLIIGSIVNFPNLILDPQNKCFSSLDGCFLRCLI
jgi:hypothetical protein